VPLDWQVILFGNGNDKLCYLTGLFIGEKKISVIGLHTIPQGSLCDCTILNEHATTDDKIHDDTGIVLRR